MKRQTRRWPKPWDHRGQQYHRARDMPNDALMRAVAILGQGKTWRNALPEARYLDNMLFECRQRRLQVSAGYSQTTCGFEGSMVKKQKPAAATASTSSGVWRWSASAPQSPS